MRRALPPLLALAVFAPLAGAGAQTAEPRPEPRLTLSISASTVGYGDLQLQPVLAQRIDEEGGEEAEAESAVLRRTVHVDGGLQAAASGTLALGPWWSIRAGVGVGRIRLGQGFAGDEPWATEARAVPVSGGTDVSLTSLETALRFRLASAHTLQPYLELGVAAERWQTRTTGTPPFPGAADLMETMTRFGGHGAVGARYPLTPRLAVRAQASVRVFRTPLRPAPGGEEIGRTDELVLTFLDPATGPFADASRALVQGTRLELGLSLGMGGAVVPRPAGSEPAGSTPDPPR